VLLAAEKRISKLIKFPGFLVVLSLRTTGKASRNIRVIFEYQDLDAGNFGYVWILSDIDKPDSNR